MKIFLGLLLAIGVSPAGFADTIKVISKGERIVIQVKGYEGGVASDLFAALSMASRDPIYDEATPHVRGEGFGAMAKYADSNDMDANEYWVNFDFALIEPSLLLEHKGDVDILKFEGRAASTLFQGLYRLRLLDERRYELQRTGQFGMEHTIITGHPFNRTECTSKIRFTSSTRAEPYASCTITTKN